MSNSTVKGEDEDELESLRLAALESLRAKGLPPPSLISLPPKPVICSNQIFQRHSGNQNLIAIIPVDQSAVKIQPNSCAKPLTNFSSSVSKPLQLPLSRLANTNNIHHPPNYAQNYIRPPTIAVVPVDKSIEEKPKASTKFSRFEDSDSEDSDEIDLSLNKSDSEEDEEGEMEILEDEFIILEESVEDLCDTLQPSKTENSKSERPSTPVETPIVEKPIERSSSPKKEETVKELEVSSNRKTCRKSVEIERKPTKPRERSAEREKTNSRSRLEARKASDKPKIAKISTAERSSPHHRSLEKRREVDRNSQPKKTVSPKSSSKESRKPVVSESERDRLESRKPVPTDSERDRLESRKPVPTDSEKDRLESRKPVLSESEKDRLESRKRKFERTNLLDPMKIEGKIRLKVDGKKDKEDRPKVALEKQPVEPVSDKKLKKMKKKIKEKKPNGSRSVCETNDGMEPAIICKNADQSIDSQSDLRAELQRRRYHRNEEDGSRSKTPDKVESRRILVLNAPSAPLSSTECNKSSRNGSRNSSRMFMHL